MKRRKFLQLSLLSPFVCTISCKKMRDRLRQEKPAVSKHKPATSRYSLDIVGAKTDDYIAVHEIVRMKVTAYCACKKCCGKYANGFTASGHKIQKGNRFVAADKRYPFGTWMYIPGYYKALVYPYSYYCQIVQVLDRGGAIKGNHIDVYFDTHQEALEWGVRYLDVTILCYKKGAKK